MLLKKNQTMPDSIFAYIKNAQIQYFYNINVILKNKNTLTVPTPTTTSTIYHKIWVPFKGILF